MLNKKFFQPAIWIAVLLLLFFMPVTDGGFSFCLFKMAGFSHCPGCGIGHAIHYALRLDFNSSLNEHFFGIPATLLIILQILKSIFNPFKIYKHGPATAYDVTRHTA